MIPEWKVDAVRVLLAEGELGQRKIAKKVKVCRGVVSTIANGRRPDYKKKREERYQDELEVVRSPFLHEDPPERCPQCKSLVYLPCVACSARAHKNGDGIHIEEVESVDTLDLELTEEQDERRLKLQERKREMGVFHDDNESRLALVLFNQDTETQICEELIQADIFSSER